MKHQHTLKIAPVRIKVYKRDCIVEYESLNKDSYKKRGESKRDAITKFSYKSRARLAFVAANTDVNLQSMATLTYPREFPSNGTIVKKQFRAMLARMKRKWDDLSYLWFLEFQARGAPHYHILLSEKINNQDMYWLADAWYEIVGSGDERHHWAGTRLENVRKEDGAARYAVKYALKMKQKEVPALYTKVGRFWGHSKDVKPKTKYKDIEVRSKAELMYVARKWPFVHRLMEVPLSQLWNAAGHIATQDVLDNLHGDV
jgi:hypothetical protein